MYSEFPKTIPVAPSFVIKRLMLAALIGSTILLALVIFMWLHGFDMAFAFSIMVLVTVITWAIYSYYKRGLRQAIKLFPNKIVFDFIASKQEYTFVSPSEWNIFEDGSNWKIIALKDQSFKLVSKLAFPKLKTLVEEFYAKAT
mgnify:CR=1 FL=1